MQLPLHLFIPVRLLLPEHVSDAKLDFSLGQLRAQLLKIGENEDTVNQLIHDLKTSISSISNSISKSHPKYPFNVAKYLPWINSAIIREVSQAGAGTMARKYLLEDLSKHLYNLYLLDIGFQTKLIPDEFVSRLNKSDISSFQQLDTELILVQNKDDADGEPLIQVIKDILSNNSSEKDIKTALEKWLYEVKPEFNTIETVGDYTIIRPLNKLTFLKLGYGTSWCTSIPNFTSGILSTRRINLKRSLDNIKEQVINSCAVYENTYIIMKDSHPVYQYCATVDQLQFMDIKDHSMLYDFIDPFDDWAEPAAHVRIMSPDNMKWIIFRLLSGDPLFADYFKLDPNIKKVVSEWWGGKNRESSCETAIKAYYAVLDRVTGTGTLRKIRQQMHSENRPIWAFKDHNAYQTASKLTTTFPNDVIVSPDEIQLYNAPVNELLDALSADSTLQDGIIKIIQVLEDITRQSKNLDPAAASHILQLLTTIKKNVKNPQYLRAFLFRVP